MLRAIPDPQAEDRQGRPSPQESRQLLLDTVHSLRSVPADLRRYGR
jgi:hypothetical protein